MRLTNFAGLEGGSERKENFDNASEASVKQNLDKASEASVNQFFTDASEATKVEYTGNRMEAVLLGCELMSL
jgi:hypothetical protein